VTIQSVFITGASTGIGAALARHYAAPGRLLGLLARREALLLEVAEVCRRQGAEVSIYPVDVTDANVVAAVGEAFLARAGRVDLVIANAGISLRDEESESEADLAWRVMAVNFLGVVHTLSSFVPAMKKNGSGSLVAISSVAGFRGLPDAGAYCASKAAVMVWMESLRVRLRGRVNVMTMCPGYVATPMTETNAFPMPWLLSAERAATLVARAIERKRLVYTFPWQMKLLMGFVRVLPPWLFDPILAAAQSRGLTRRGPRSTVKP